MFQYLVSRTVCAKKRSHGVGTPPGFLFPGDWTSYSDMKSQCWCPPCQPTTVSCSKKENSFSGTWDLVLTASGVETFCFTEQASKQPSKQTATNTQPSQPTGHPATCPTKQLPPPMSVEITNCRQDLADVPPQGRLQQQWTIQDGKLCRESVGCQWLPGAGF